MLDKKEEESCSCYGPKFFPDQLQFSGQKITNIFNHENLLIRFPKMIFSMNESLSQGMMPQNPRRNPARRGTGGYDNYHRENFSKKSPPSLFHQIILPKTYHNVPIKLKKLNSVTKFSQLIYNNKIIQYVGAIGSY
jgi:hypothetical protein